MVLVRRDEDVLCAPPNGSRLSCSALVKDQIPLRALPASSACWATWAPILHCQAQKWRPVSMVRLGASRLLPPQREAPTRESLPSRERHGILLHDPQEHRQRG